MQDKEEDFKKKKEEKKADIFGAKLAVREAPEAASLLFAVVHL